MTGIRRGGKGDTVVEKRGGGRQTPFLVSTPLLKHRSGRRITMKNVKRKQPTLTSDKPPNDSKAKEETVLREDVSQ